jgi:hypothetical protein
VRTYDFFALFHTRLNLMNLSLRLIVGDFINLMFPDDAQRLFGVQLPLAYMPGNTRSGHVRGLCVCVYVCMCGWVGQHRSEMLPQAETIRFMQDLCKRRESVQDVCESQQASWPRSQRDLAPSHAGRVFFSHRRGSGM